MRVEGPSVDWRGRVVLGRTGRLVSRLGIGSSYGVPAAAIERAYAEYGVNYLYWGTFRRAGMADAIRHLSAQHRDDLVVVLQSYSRLALLLRRSVERALRTLGLDAADVLLLGLHNRPPSRRILDAAIALRDTGRVRWLAVSSHRRATFADYRASDQFDVWHFRYNAAHRGAEQEVFPLLADRSAGPGTVAYTATRWGHLLDPHRIPQGAQVPSASDCYRFVLSHTEVDVCMTGPATAAEMADALTALERGPMSPDELDWMTRMGEHIHRQPLDHSLRSRLWRIGGAS
jgi:aryl-alcohol dehydrogenase-like predicted oxidoreductase